MTHDCPDDRQNRTKMLSFASINTLLKEIISACLDRLSNLS